jgi:N-acetylglutamate synthase-like GNAT family acetyltransferase
MTSIRWKKWDGKRLVLQAKRIGGFMLETNAEPPLEAGVTLRTDLRPGDMGAVIELHGRIYAREYGFDHTFEAYVAGPLAEFSQSADARERIWLAERDGKIVGCIAIVASAPDVAQLRWFLVDPSARGLGIGKTLVHEAVAFCRSCRYKSVILWTVSVLTAAANLYRSMGFRLVERKPVKQWGVDVIEERYELDLE